MCKSFETIRNFFFLPDWLVGSSIDKTRLYVYSIVSNFEYIINTLYIFYDSKMNYKHTTVVNLINGFVRFVFHWRGIKKLSHARITNFPSKKVFSFLEIEREKKKRMNRKYSVLVKYLSISIEKQYKICLKGKKNVDRLSASCCYSELTKQAALKQ